MRRRFLNLLLAAALLAAAARLSTALRAPPPQLPATPAAEADAPAPTPAATAETAATPEGGAPTGPESYDTIVARDLFSATRGVVPPAPPAPAKPPPKPAAQPKLTLTGVVIVDGEKSAFLQEGSAEARPRKVREGDSFAGGTVKAIRPDGITFFFAGSETAVPLRTPKDVGPAPRPGEVTAPPQQPADALVRRPVQPGLPDAGGQVQVPRPPQGLPGVPRLVQPPEEEPVIEDEFIDEGEVDDTFVDEGEVFDETDIPPEDFEEPVE